MSFILHRICFKVVFVFQEHIPSVQMSEIAGNSIREWELDSLIRTRALEQITTARITLQVRNYSFLIAKI